ncbi:MAG TPA: hypothetical protein VGU90_04280 [Terriglobales bacterium]|jgi:hypothetical protein|nr:hypothetical protein [Terriglobales bacterium]
MSSEQVISELENRRKLLNDKLMNAKTVREANEIERELWALRAAIRYRKRLPKSENLERQSPQVSQPGA